MTETSPCEGLRPRRAVRALAFRAPVRVAFRDLKRVGARDQTSFAAQRLAYAPPADASPAPSRVQAHGSGPRWVATPSSWWTRTTYSLPVSRRTQIKYKLLHVKQRDEPRREPATRQVVRGEPAPSPLVLHLVENILSVAPVAIELAERLCFFVERSDQNRVFVDFRRFADLDERKLRRAAIVA